MLTCDLLVFLHQGNVKFGVLVDLDSELRIVKPSVIAFILNVFSQLIGFVFGLQQKVFGLRYHVLFDVGFLSYGKSFIIKLIEIRWASTSVGLT